MDGREKEWKLFITVAEEKNITRAADKLFMTQPSLSYRLTQLEKDMAEPLLIRSTRGVELTETGELYYEYCLDMLKRTVLFEETLENKKSTISGTLHLGSSSIFANYELPDILEGFTKQYPKVNIHVRTGMSQEISQLFTDNEIHVAIIRGPHYPSGERLPISVEPICLVTSKDCNHEELPTLPLIRYKTDPALYSIVDMWWKENFAEPYNNCIELDTMETCRHFIQRGLGWSLLPWTGLARLKDTLYIKSLYWKSGAPILRETNLYYRDQQPYRKPVKAFLDYMQEYVKDKANSKV